MYLFLFLPPLVDLVVVVVAADLLVVLVVLLALPAIWTTIFYLYPFERTFIAVISTILSIAIYKRTKILLDNN